MDPIYGSQSVIAWLANASEIRLQFASYSDATQPVMSSRATALLTGATTRQSVVASGQSSSAAIRQGPRPTTTVVTDCQGPSPATAVVTDCQGPSPATALLTGCRGPSPSSPARRHSLPWRHHSVTWSWLSPCSSPSSLVTCSKLWWWWRWWWRFVYQWNNWSSVALLLCSLLFTTCFSVFWHCYCHNITSHKYCFT